MWLYNLHHMASTYPAHMRSQVENHLIFQSYALLGAMCLFDQLQHTMDTSLQTPLYISGGKSPDL